MIAFLLGVVYAALHVAFLSLSGDVNIPRAVISAVPPAIAVFATALMVAALFGGWSRRSALALSTVVAVAVGGAFLMSMHWGLKTDDNELLIRSLGTKSDASSGSEVWVLLLNADGQRIPLAEVSRTSGWIEKDNQLLTGQAGELRWHPGNREAFSLSFVQHPFSGRIELIWQGESQVIDLYKPADRQGPLKIDLNVPLKITRASIVAGHYAMVLLAVVVAGLGVAVLSFLRESSTMPVNAAHLVSATLALLLAQLLSFSLVEYGRARPSELHARLGAAVEEAVRASENLSVAQAPKADAPGPAPATLSTSLYDLSVERSATPAASQRGALAVRDNLILFAGQKGELYQVDLTKPLSFRKLDFSVPVDLSAPALSKFEQNTLSVLDIELYDISGQPTLFASYLSYDERDDCVFISLSSTGVRVDGGLLGAGGVWKEIYQTKPCVSVSDLDSGSLFGTGGRIELFEDQILLTIASLGLDGLGKALPVSQLDDQDYGKILLISQTGAVSHFTKGHRNPQGMTVLSNGAAVVSEHSAQGGDEINFLSKGENYGWPLVSLGTGYGSKVWPPNKNNGQHLGYRVPFYSFVPSIAPTELVEIKENAQFPLWEHDLLLASLRQQTIFRIRYDDSHVLFAEPIKIGNRLRDMGVAADGSIILITDDSNEMIVLTNKASNVARATPDQTDAEFQTVAAPVADNPGAKFQEACSSCHSLTDGTDKAGPSLGCIVGRKIGSVEGFAYSPALAAKSGDVWTKADLEAFVADPEEWAPGTNMPSAAIKDPNVLRAIVDYLETAPASCSTSQ